MADLEREIELARCRLMAAYAAGKKAEARMHYRVMTGLIRQRTADQVRDMERRMFGRSFCGGER